MDEFLLATVWKKKEPPVELQEVLAIRWIAAIYRTFQNGVVVQLSWLPDTF